MHPLLTMPLLHYINKSLHGVTSKLHTVCVCKDKLKIKVYASDLYFKSNKKDATSCIMGNVELIISGKSPHILANTKSGTAV